jgi:hypothetical protein
MTPFERLIEALTSVTLTPWIIFKILYLLGFLLYIAFAVIVVRQVNLMIQTLNGVLRLPLKIVALIHLGVAVFIFWLALMTL